MAHIVFVKHPLKNSVSLLLLAAFSGVLAAPALAQSAIRLPGLFNTRISSDGLTAGGVFRTAPSQTQAVFWHATTGLQPTGRVVSPNNYTGGLSGNGHFLTGTLFESPGFGQGFRLSDQGVLTIIPALVTPSDGASVGGISDDGNTIVGDTLYAGGSSVQAWRWTVSGGLQTLPFFRATAVSGDGNTIIGDTFTPNDAVLRNGVITQLPYVDDGTGGFRSSTGYAVNFDGSIIVGQSGNSPAIWVNGQGSLIPSPAGSEGCFATDINADATVILGTNGLSNAFIWTPSRGSELLSSYFASYGITLPGYQLTSATVSDDGRTFAVNTIIPSTLAPNAFIITIPTSGTLSVGLLGIALASRRRR